MRIRTIKPEFWTHPQLSRLNDSSRLMAIGLLNLADDEGYFRAEAALVKSALRPFDEDSSTTQGALTELSRIGFVSIHQHPEAGEIGYVINFRKHQKINRSTPSKLKKYAPEHSLTAHSVSPHGALTDDSLLEGKGREQGTGNGMEGEVAQAIQLPDGFPKSETESVRNVRGIQTTEAQSIPEQWIKDVWGKLAGRGGKDGQGIIIINWAPWLVAAWRKWGQEEWTRAQSLDHRGSGNSAEKKEGGAKRASSEPVWDWRRLSADLDPEHLEPQGEWDQQTPRFKSDIRSAFANLPSSSQADYAEKKERGAA